MANKSLLMLIKHVNRLFSLRGERIPNSSFLNAVMVRRRRYTTEKSAEKLPPPEAEPAANNSQNPANTKDHSKEIEIITAEIKSLKQKNDELLDKYKRALADGENMRVRLSKQISDAKIFAIQNFCKDLLEVADTLGKATLAVPKEELHDKNPQLKNLYDGLMMTRASFSHVFKRHGLETINPLNEKFDPNFHEALFQKEDSTVEPNTVIEVSKLGYKLHDRCIRPALVGVSKL